MNTYNMNQYQQNQISTASPEQILLMLYDGAIRFTRQAIQGIEENNLDQRRVGISKTMAIIAEFSNSLNHEVGGQIADDLDSLYDFMMRELTNANIHNDVEKLRVVEKLLMDLRQTWAEAVIISRKESAAAVPVDQYPPETGIGKESTAAVSADQYPPATYKPLSISR